MDKAIKSMSHNNLSFLFQNINDQYYPDIFRTIVENLASTQFHSSSSNSIYTHAEMQGILFQVGNRIIEYLRKLQEFATLENNQPDLYKIGVEYGSTFQLAATYLNNKITVSSNASSSSPPSLLFFHIGVIIKSALYYLHSENMHLDTRESKFNQGLAILVDALAKYKTHIGNQHNDTISMWFEMEDKYLNSKDEFIHVQRFSDKWWASLFYDYALYSRIKINPEILQLVDSPYGNDDLPLPTIIFPLPLVSTTSFASGLPSNGTTAIMSFSSTTSPPQEIVPASEAVLPTPAVHCDPIDAGVPLQSIPSPNLSLSHSPLSSDSHPSPELNIVTSPHPTESHTATTSLTPGHPRINTLNPEELTPKLITPIPASTIDTPPGVQRASSNAIQDSSAVDDTILAPTAAPSDLNSDAPPVNLAISRVDDTNIVDEQALTTIASTSVLISSPISRSDALPENALLPRIGDSVIEMNKDAEDKDVHKD
ncbi:hypothetical protein BDN70DRAFT_898318 [Pholiota conissans]|uniref:Uncharacterized protein n=1 Tax=Pholiota conissans TaxID=109636 RepID=A0A9P5YVA0_9AGAR|nr:hypothetical protein BDN70DRAFT_898318 [Pholiota conissans]